MGHEKRDGTSAAPGSAVLTPPLGLPAVGGPAIPAQRTAPPSPRQPVAPPEVPVGVRMCTCGHAEDAHEHYRSGHDCGACGSAACPSFRDRDEPDGRLRRLLRRAGRR